MEWTVNSPKFGDIIRTKVTFYHHYGIFINENRIIQFGLPDNVYTPAEEIKVLATDIYTFLQGGELEVGKPTRQELKNMRSPEEIVKLAESRLGQGGYDILHNNCEHFVNECAFGEHNSEFLSSVRNKIRKKLGK
ncbi:MAG: lecithin retinol acyltransferase family protein [Acutalibacteraceae bacterium]|nr:lecithin retinol acyltransferase family protein [Acutalibacteraceae bacterium]